MKDRGRRTSPDQGLDGNDPLNDENEVNDVGEFSPIPPSSENEFAFAQICYDVYGCGLERTA